MTEITATKKFKGAPLRLRFVQAWVDQDGRAQQYFRRAGFPRVRLPGLPGSPEFNRVYEAALGSASEPIGASRSKPGSVAAVIAAYFASPAFRKDLKPDTQAVRRFVLEAFKREHGDKLIRHMPRSSRRVVGHDGADRRQELARRHPCPGALRHQGGPARR